MGKPNSCQTYAEERREGIIWAPKENKAGKTQYHWENVAKVKRATSYSIMSTVILDRFPS